MEIYSKNMEENKITKKESIEDEEVQKLMNTDLFSSR